jgi:hypothetical protein
MKNRCAVPPPSHFARHGIGRKRNKIIRPTCTLPLSLLPRGKTGGPGATQAEAIFFKPIKLRFLENYTAAA